MARLRASDARTRVLATTEDPIGERNESMRELSESFMAALQTGFLAAITRQVIGDKDLDLHIRDGYINIYFKVF